MKRQLGTLRNFWSVSLGVMVLVLGFYVMTEVSGILSKVRWIKNLEQNETSLEAYVVGRLASDIGLNGVYPALSSVGWGENEGYAPVTYISFADLNPHTGEFRLLLQPMFVFIQNDNLKNEIWFFMDEVSFEYEDVLYLKDGVWAETSYASCRDDICTAKLKERAQEMLEQEAPNLVSFRIVAEVDIWKDWKLGYQYPTYGYGGLEEVIDRVLFLLFLNASDVGIAK